MQTKFIEIQGKHTDYFINAQNITHVFVGKDGLTHIYLNGHGQEPSIITTELSYKKIVKLIKNAIKWKWD